MNRFYSFLFAAVLILAGGGAARAQNAAWARAFPNARVLFGQPRQMATDAAGHSYLTGFFTGTLVLGTDTLREADTSAPGRRADVFLAKYDAQGEVMWAKAIASPGGDTALAVAVDGSGNVLVAGSSAAGLTVGTTVLPNATCWLARFSGAGAPQWVTALFPSNAHEPMITALAADTAGNCYLAASSHDMQAVGTHALTHTSGGIALVARIDGAGMVSGVQEFAGRVRIYDLAVSGQGTLFCTGGAWNQVVFGPQPSHILTGPDSAVVFVAKISAALQTEWVRAGRAYPGRGISIGTTLTADAAGNCYLAGWCLGGMRLSVGVYTTKSGIFFAKYDDQGNVQWFREQEGSQSGFTYPSVMTTDGSGNVYTAGFYQNPGLRFGSYALSAGIS
ncbi:MAG TPA: hypothetical protein VEI97_21075, partial [bacterium]|nr:hypothetical protein [bacterium]